MGLSIISIMLFHLRFVSIFPFSLFYNFGHFGVDMFFFLSGFGLVFSLKKNSSPKVFYTKRLKRLFYPIVFCGIIKYILSYTLYPFNVSPRGISTLVGLDLWFFKPLICFYLVAPFAYFLFKRTSAAIISISTLFICIALLILFPNNLNYIIEWSIARFPAFILGMSVAMGWTPKIIIRYGWILAICAYIFGEYLVSKFPFASYQHTFTILSFSLPSIAYYISIFIDKFRESVFYTSVTFCGLISLEIYLWHEYIYTICDYTITNRYFAFIAAISASILIAYSCNKILKKILAFT